jgi:hypothetical protein
LKFEFQVLVNTFPSIEEISIWNYRKASATALAEKVGNKDRFNETETKTEK